MNRQGLVLLWVTVVVVGCTHAYVSTSSSHGHHASGRHSLQHSGVGRRQEQHHARSSKTTTTVATTMKMTRGLSRPLVFVRNSGSTSSLLGSSSSSNTEDYDHRPHDDYYDVWHDSSHQQQQMMTMTSPSATMTPSSPSSSDDYYNKDDSRNGHHHRGAMSTSSASRRPRPRNDDYGIMEHGDRTSSSSYPVYPSQMTTTDTTWATMDYYDKPPTSLSMTMEKMAKAMKIPTGHYRAPAPPGSPSNTNNPKNPIILSSRDDLIYPSQLMGSSSSSNSETIRDGSDPMASLTDSDDKEDPDDSNSAIVYYDLDEWDAHNYKNQDDDEDNQSVMMTTTSTTTNDNDDDVVTETHDQAWMDWDDLEQQAHEYAAMTTSILQKEFGPKRLPLMQQESPYELELATQQEFVNDDHHGDQNKEDPEDSAFGAVTTTEDLPTAAIPLDDNGGGGVDHDTVAEATTMIPGSNDMNDIDTHRHHPNNLSMEELVQQWSSIHAPSVEEEQDDLMSDPTTTPHVLYNTPSQEEKEEPQDNNNKIDHNVVVPWTSNSHTSRDLAKEWTMRNQETPLVDTSSSSSFSINPSEVDRSSSSQHVPKMDNQATSYPRITIVSSSSSSSSSTSPPQKAIMTSSWTSLAQEWAQMNQETTETPSSLSPHSASQMPQGASTPASTTSSSSWLDLAKQWAQINNDSSDMDATPVLPTATQMPPKSSTTTMSLSVPNLAQEWAQHQQMNHDTSHDSAMPKFPSSPTSLTDTTTAASTTKTTSSSWSDLAQEWAQMNRDLGDNPATPSSFSTMTGQASSSTSSAKTASKKPPSFGGGDQSMGLTMEELAKQWSELNSEHGTDSTARSRQTQASTASFVQGAFHSKDAPSAAHTTRATETSTLSRSSSSAIPGSVDTLAKEWATQMRSGDHDDEDMRQTALAFQAAVPAAVVSPKAMQEPNKTESLLAFVHPSTQELAKQWVDMNRGDGNAGDESTTSPNFTVATSSGRTSLDEDDDDTVSDNTNTLNTSRDTIVDATTATMELDAMATTTTTNTTNAATSAVARTVQTIQPDAASAITTTSKERVQLNKDDMDSQIHLKAKMMEDSLPPPKPIDYYIVPKGEEVDEHGYFHMTGEPLTPGVIPHEMMDHVESVMSTDTSEFVSTSANNDPLPFFMEKVFLSSRSDEAPSDFSSEFTSSVNGRIGNSPYEETEIVAPLQKNKLQNFHVVRDDENEHMHILKKNNKERQHQEPKLDRRIITRQAMANAKAKRYVVKQEVPQQEHQRQQHSLLHKKIPDSVSSLPVHIMEDVAENENIRRVMIGGFFAMAANALGGLVGGTQKQQSSSPPPPPFSSN